MDSSRTASRVERWMFLLCCGSRQIPLPQGGCVIGRGGDCQIILDDGLASRRHAFLKVSPDGVTLQDLGARNGVFVNGERVEGTVSVAVGDEILIGQTQLVLQHGLGPAPAKVARPSLRQTAERNRTEDADVEESAAVRSNAGKSNSPARSSAPVVGPPPTSDPAGARLDVTAHADLLGLLGTVADKSIAQGRPDQAERLLQRHLAQILLAARGGRLNNANELELAARQAVKLASATSKGEWVDYVFELYTCTKRVLPAPIIDDLYQVVRRVSSMSLTPVKSYLEAMRGKAAELTPAQRFLLQRTEGLERVVLSR